MAETGRSAPHTAGEPDSSPTHKPAGWWRSLRRWFERGDADQSLRAHLEDIIDEHEEDGPDAGAPEHDLAPSQRLMLRNVLHFSESDAGDVCIPRSEIIALPHNADWAEVVAGFAEHGHSRMPVYRDTLDEVIGMMLIKDIFPYLARGEEPHGNWTRLMRQPLFVPTARGALDVLADMRSSRVHLAVVVDEYSGTEGIITFEDLVEEIVGEVEDEHDDAPAPLLRARADGVWEADAKALLETVAEMIDPRLAEVEEDIDTLGGLAFVMAGHVPETGTKIPHPSGWTIEVTKADERHVIALALYPPRHSAAPGPMAEKD